MAMATLALARPVMVTEMGMAYARHHILPAGNHVPTRRPILPTVESAELSVVQTRAAATESVSDLVARRVRWSVTALASICSAIQNFAVAATSRAPRAKFVQTDRALQNVLAATSRAMAAASIPIQMISFVARPYAQLKLAWAELARLMKVKYAARGRRVAKAAVLPTVRRVQLCAMARALTRSRVVISVEQQLALMPEQAVWPAAVVKYVLRARARRIVPATN